MRGLTLPAGLLGLLCSITPTMASGDIVVTGAWARPSLGEANATALYMTLRNDGTQPDELTGVTTEAAGMSEVHVSKLDNGVVSMQPIGRLQLPPGGTVVFEPKGNHVMLMMLAHPLKASEHISVVLHFAVHPPETIDAVISMSPPLQ